MCNKYAIWIEPDFCPLFTITANIPASTDDSLVGHSSRMAKFNKGNNYPAHLEWFAGGFNPYHAVFTVYRQLAAADESLLYVRGPLPDVTIVFAEVFVKPYVGSDTRFNYLTGYPPVTGTNIMVTSKDFPTYSKTDLTNVKDMEYVHYGFNREEYVTNLELDTCTQLVVNGDAEMGVLEGWKNIHGGYLSLYDCGLGLLTQIFRYSNCVHYNLGYGQYLDVSCFQLGVLYKIKAKYRLLDKNGFPYACDPTAMANSPLSMACPL